MQTRLVDNSGIPLLDNLLPALSKARRACLAVAFAADSGVKAIWPATEECLSAGASVEVLVGLDFYTTEPAALQRLHIHGQQYATLSLLCFANPPQHKHSIFHPKMYYIEKSDGECWLAVGSSNLTGGGLGTNYEVNCIVSGQAEDAIFASARGIYERFRTMCVPFHPDHAYIQRYTLLHQKAQKNKRVFERDTAIREEVEALAEYAEQLPHIVPTQRRLVIEAIKASRTPGQEWVDLKTIYAYVHRRARSLNLPYDWDTLNNSIRGRLNEATLEAPRSPGLFERYGGRYGRRGLYRLTERGEHYGEKRQ